MERGQWRGRGCHHTGSISSRIGRMEEWILDGRTIPLSNLCVVGQSELLESQFCGSTNTGRTTGVGTRRHPAPRNPVVSPRLDSKFLFILVSMNKNVLSQLGQKPRLM
jgi:hypothetical protein